jgi:hypothetical protein
MRQHGQGSGKGSAAGMGEILGSGVLGARKPSSPAAAAAGSRAGAEPFSRPAGQVGRRDVRNRPTGFGRNARLPDLFDHLPSKRLRDVVTDRTKDANTPCLWFDEQTRRCRHWEHRPEVSRGFVVGSEACLVHREQRGIDEG